MELKYRSKIGWWFHLTILFIIAVGCVMPVVLGVRYGEISSLVIGIIMSALTVIFIFPMYLNTYYTLEETTLYIRCGFIMNKRIPYDDIKGVYETKDPSASVGLSLDRISINYSGGEILISPRNKQEFLEELERHRQDKGPV